MLVSAPEGRIVFSKSWPPLILQEEKGERKVVGNDEFDVGFFFVYKQQFLKNEEYLANIFVFEKN